MTDPFCLGWKSSVWFGRGARKGHIAWNAGRLLPLKQSNSSVVLNLFKIFLRFVIFVNVCFWWIATGVHGRRGSVCEVCRGHIASS